MNRFFIGLLIVGALAACGGGGSTPTPVSTATPTVAPTATSTSGTQSTATASPAPLPSLGAPTGTLATKATQQGIVSQGLTGYTAFAGALEVINEINGGAIARNPAVKQLLALVRAKHSATAPSSHRVRPLAVATPGACASGVETGTSDGPGTDEVQTATSYFYDVACTQLEENEYIDANATSSTATAVATIDIFSTSGPETGYLTENVSDTEQASGDQLTLQTTVAAGKGDTAFADADESCSVSDVTASCGSGTVVHSAANNADAGYDQSTSVNSNASSIVLTGTGQTTTGALNTITVSAGTFPAWSVVGGTSSGTIGINATFTNTTQPTIAVADTVNNGTFTLTIYGGGTEGVLTETSTGAVAATFLVDTLGNGTINYSNGSTGLIQDFFLVN